jgi:hypothetical protein
MAFDPGAKQIKDYATTNRQRTNLCAYDGALYTSTKQIDVQSNFTYNINTTYDVTTTTSGTGANITNPIPQVAALNVSGASTQSVTLTSKRCIRYRPGCSIFAEFGLNYQLTSGGTVVAIGGPNNGTDGPFIGYSYTGSLTSNSLVLGYYKNGVINSVSQGSFNGDNVNGGAGGINPSGLTYSPTASSPFRIVIGGIGVNTISYEWYGSNSSGDYGWIVLHTSNNINQIIAPTFQTLYLPMRFVLSCTTGGGNSTMNIFGYCAGTFGTYTTLANIRPYSGQTTKNAGTTGIPFISLQVPTSINSVNNGILTQISSITASSAVTTLDTTLYFAQIILNPTLTGASFATTGGSTTQFDSSATAYSGGTVMRQFTFVENSDFISVFGEDEIKANAGDIISFVIQTNVSIIKRLLRIFRIVSKTTNSVTSTINWSEKF